VVSKADIFIVSVTDIFAMSIANIFTMSIANIFVDFNKILFTIIIEFKTSPFSIPITLTGFNPGTLTNIIILLLDDKWEAYH